MNSNNKSKFIIANWKMNPVSSKEADNIIRTVKRGIEKTDNVNVVICPPYFYIPNIKSETIFDIGVQNVFWEDSGAYTGEISSKMAKNLGVNYAIIGHSERRIHLGETDKIVNLKINSALKNSIKPILCVGESQKERNEDMAGDIIASEIEKGLEGVPSGYLVKDLIIVYEPIWAIGTGNTPTSDEIMSMALLIRKVITKLYDRKTADNLPILYGGSVNSQNALDFVDKAGMDGLLVGGASLNASEFVRIVNLFG